MANLPTLAVAPMTTLPIAGDHPQVAAQHAILAKQLTDLAALRKDMQGLYETSQSDLQTTRAELAVATKEAAREREERERVGAENVELRRWNTKLAEDLSRLLGDIRGIESALADGSTGDGFDEEAEYLAAMTAASLHNPSGGQAPSSMSALCSRHSWRLQRQLSS